MRKPTVILLLICFLLQTGGLWLLMHFRQMELKQEMRSKLRANPGQFAQTVFEFELTKGKVMASSFEWEEEDEEFRYNGSMYDVIEKKVTGNIIQLRCVDDKKEADILKQMEDLQKKERGGNDKSWPTSFQQLLSLQLFCQHNSYEHTTQLFALQHTDQYCERFSFIVIDIISPPPRRVNSSYC